MDEMKYSHFIISGILLMFALVLLATWLRGQWFLS